MEDDPPREESGGDIGGGGNTSAAPPAAQKSATFASSEELTTIRVETTPSTVSSATRAMAALDVHTYVAALSLLASMPRALIPAVCLRAAASMAPPEAALNKVDEDASHLPSHSQPQQQQQQQPFSPSCRHGGERDAALVRQMETALNDILAAALDIRSAPVDIVTAIPAHLAMEAVLARLEAPQLARQVLHSSRFSA